MSKNSAAKSHRQPGQLSGSIAKHSGLPSSQLWTLHRSDYSCKLSPLSSGRFALPLHRFLEQRKKRARAYNFATQLEMLAAQKRHRFRDGAGIHPIRAKK